MSGKTTKSGSSWKKVDKGDFVDRCRKIPFLGLLMAVAGGVAFALTLVLVKLSRVFPLMVLFERSVLQFLVFLSAVIFSGHSPVEISDKRGLLLGCLVAIFGAFFPIMCHSAIFFMPVADAVAIFFASPAFITLYGCAVTRKNPGLYKIIVVGLALTGVLFVTKPVLVFGSDQDISQVSWLEGCLLAIGSSVSYAGFCLSSSHCKDLTVESLNLLVSCCTLLFNVPILVGLDLFRIPSCGSEAAYALASAVTGVLAVLFLILATKLEQAGPVAIGNAVELPAVIVFQVLLTREAPSWNSYLGSALIVTSVLISGWLRWQQDRKLVYNKVAVKKVPKEAVLPIQKQARPSVDLSLLEESNV